MLGTILVIAGSDSGGEAGIQKDLKTLNSLKAHTATVITAITSQNSKKVSDIYPLPIKIIGSQINSALQGYDIKAIKIGMVYDLKILKKIKEIIEKKAKNIPIIFDPVWISTSGKELSKFDDNFIKFLKKDFLKTCHIFTPNIEEAQKILNRKIKDLKDMQEACLELNKYGSKAVLLKGGHLKSEKKITDILAINNKIYQFTNKKINKNHRGTGCILSSALAFYLVKTGNIRKSVDFSRKFLFKILKKN